MSLKSGLMTGTTLPADGIAAACAHKVWRVEILGDELRACGFENSVNPWELVLKPLLIAKGLPEGFTLDRTPARITPDEENDKIILEFE